MSASALIQAAALKRKPALQLVSGLRALAIAGIQWLGFYHGIVHSSVGVEAQFSSTFEHTSQSGPIQSGQAQSSCHLFDALVLGGGLVAVGFTFHPQQQSNSLLAAVFISQAKQTAFWPYQSQAPPTLNL